MYLELYHDIQIKHASYEEHDQYFKTTQGDRVDERRGRGCRILKKMTNRSRWVRVCDEQIIARITSVYFAVIYGILAIIGNLGSAMDHFFSGIILKDLSRLGNAGRNVGDALVSVVVLPVIGILGILMPKTAVRCSEKTLECLELILVKKPKKNFGAYSGRIMSPIRGLIMYIPTFVSGVGNIAISPFTYNSKKTILRGVKIVIISPGLPFCGVAGIISKKARDFLGINIVAKA